MAKKLTTTQRGGTTPRAEANYSKRDRTVKEHLDYCVEVLSHHGYLVEEPKT